MKIYVASSWRNPIQLVVVQKLREAGHDVYDFKNPEPGNYGFHWSEIDPNWRNWSAQEFIKALNHPSAITGFDLDFNALVECDACVLVLPCGRSAHLEAGFAAGAGKPLVILLADENEPELMYNMTPFICTSIEDVVAYLGALQGGKGAYWVEHRLYPNCAGKEAPAGG